jgi:hypothetical protein
LFFGGNKTFLEKKWKFMEKYDFFVFLKEWKVFFFLVNMKLLLGKNKTYFEKNENCFGKNGYFW